MENYERNGGLAVDIEIIFIKYDINGLVHRCGNDLWRMIYGA
jgi:hypothetical protein